MLLRDDKYIDYKAIADSVKDALANSFFYTIETVVYEL